MEIKEENLEEEIQKHKNIPLILDSYNDIFSDFDPRSFSERALSDDFLLECKRAARDKDEFELELVLSVPASKRNLSHEIKIKKRLRDHFKKHHQEKEKEITKVKKEGVLWVVLGAAIMIGVLFGLVRVSNLLLNSILTLLEIPSWFLVWEGLGKLIIDSRKLEPDYLFYKKMANVRINFASY